MRGQIDSSSTNETDESVVEILDKGCAYTVTNAQYAKEERYFPRYLAGWLAVFPLPLQSVTPAVHCQGPFLPPLLLLYVPWPVAFSETF